MCSEHASSRLHTSESLRNTVLSRQQDQKSLQSPVQRCCDILVILVEQRRCLLIFLSSPDAGNVNDEAVDMLLMISNWRHTHTP